MAKDNQRLEQEFIATLLEKTGHPLTDWMALIAASGHTKPNAILYWLKESYSLNHAQANFLAGIFLNNGQPVYDYGVLFAKLFLGKEPLLPLYRHLESSIQASLPSVVFIPTKAYVSIEGQRCFACATLTKASIRVGLDLGEQPFDAYTQKAKGLGAMPNLSHMFEIATQAEVTANLVGFVERAYRRVHHG
jgi:hypothetical protein